ncbi:MAG: hypothetical protein GY759_12740 [Chloroflexi bacterium]|nr:hypothetical protein [Chloroflexota bacterium]
MNAEKADSFLFDRRHQRLSASHSSAQRVIGHYDIVLIRPAEIAGHYGYANIHEVKEWIDPSSKDKKWSMAAPLALTSGSSA